MYSRWIPAVTRNRPGTEGGGRSLPHAPTIFLAARQLAVVGSTMDGERGDIRRMAYGGWGGPLPHTIAPSESPLLFLRIEEWAKSGAQLRQNTIPDISNCHRPFSPRLDR